MLSPAPVCLVPSSSRLLPAEPREPAVVGAPTRPHWPRVPRTHDICVASMDIYHPRVSCAVTSPQPNPTTLTLPGMHGLRGLLGSAWGVPTNLLTFLLPWGQEVGAAAPEKGSRLPSAKRGRLPSAKRGRLLRQQQKAWAVQGPPLRRARLAPRDRILLPSPATFPFAPPVHGCVAPLPSSWPV